MELPTAIVVAVGLWVAAQVVVGALIVRAWRDLGERDGVDLNERFRTRRRKRRFR